MCGARSKRWQLLLLVLLLLSLGTSSVVAQTVTIPLTTWQELQRKVASFGMQLEDLTQRFTEQEMKLTEERKAYEMALNDRDSYIATLNNSLTKLTQVKQKMATAVWIESTLLTVAIGAVILLTR